MNFPVKVCGLTRAQDARLAWELGASALGFIFHPASPRCVSADQVRRIRAELPAEALCVGVFVDAAADQVNRIADAAGLGAVQLHGRETPQCCEAITRPVLKAVRAEDEARLEAYPVCAFLLDAVHPRLAGGTGLKADWDLARRIAMEHPLILAGGLGPGNLREAAEAVCPRGFDLSSGVEVSPGIKDPVKLAALFAQLDPKGTRPCLLP